MSGELNYVQNPWRVRIRWLLVYVLIIALLVIAAFLTYGRIQTYRLPNGGVTLHIPYTRYLVGETVSFTVTNNFDSSVYVANGCPGEPLRVYKYTNKKWVPIHDKTAIENCKDQERSVEIPAHSKLTATFADWPHLFNKPGTYRIAMQVQYYDTVPYQDFKVIAKPKPVSLPSTTSDNDSSSLTNTSGSSVSSIEQGEEGVTSSNPQTYTVYVDASGHYSVTSLSLRPGDSIRIVYKPPYHDEVRTMFSPISGTNTGVSSVTVDQEYTTRTRQFTSEGTWSFRAVDHNGNTGIIRVDD